MQFTIIFMIQDNINDLTNISDCYSPNTIIEYRRNLDQIIIYLDSKNNSNCTTFPKGIDINLTFSETNALNTATQPYQFTIEGFNYSTTTQLVINQVPDLSALNLQYVLVEIYSFAEITQIQVYNVNEIVSSLTQCFYDNTTILISSTGLTLKLTATGLCKIQINDMIKLDLVMTTGILSFLVANQVTLQDLKTNYDQDVTFTVTLAGDYTSLWNVQQIAARIYISSSTSAIKFTFSLINYQSVAFLFAIGLMFQSDDHFNVLAKVYPAVFDPFMANARAIGFDTIVMRINYATQGFTLQKTILEFDTNQMIYEFGCDEDDPVFQSNCLTQYAYIKQNFKSTRVFFELLFYSGSTVKLVHKTLLTQYGSIYDKVTVKIDQKGFNFLTYYSGTQFQTATQFNFSVQSLSNVIPTAIPALQVNTTWSAKDISFVYSCPVSNSTCVQLAQQLLMNTTAKFLVYFYYNGTTLINQALPIILVYETNYHTVFDVSISIGVIVAFICSVSTAIQIVLFKRSIIALKKKKKQI
ncbi:Conserved_hypothetical protein [Hexamita inflata]|uniref:Transmembrane protein n=1 Tax=Hexamita inflata TaxID=28002 RepID=A0ABP1GEC9_9EUKA